MINNYENKQARMGDMGSNLLYLLVGGGIGATVALLFAPKPGRELRQDASTAVNKTVSQFKETADDYYHKAQEKASALYQVAFKAAGDGTQEAKEFTDKTLEGAQEMIQDESSANSEQMTPMFESGDESNDQRNFKTGIL